MQQLATFCHAIFSKLCTTLYRIQVSIMLSYFTYDSLTDNRSKDKKKKQEIK